MAIQLEVSSEELNELQEHMAYLVHYYESDVAVLGRAEDYVTGNALDYLQKLLKKRVELLDSADHLWCLLSRY